MLPHVRRHPGLQVAHLTSSTTGATLAAWKVFPGWPRPPPTHSGTSNGPTHQVQTTNLHQLDHVRVVQFLQDGDLLVDSFQGTLDLREAFRCCFSSSRGGASWQPSEGRMRSETGGRRS